ncbi:type II toxin-antitoxin system VapC family toxin [Nocardia sp. NPDC051832]|uniref:type II toxin-antitoxin system VapC family toxin n=1 Tax=Nocardia sp. NPDC051832 TaxID=3155673 RepID=UPI00343651B1
MASSERVVVRTGYLLDTNAISEWMKPLPDRGLMEWSHATDEDLLFLSVVTIGEVRRGIERLPEGRRKARLTTWLAEEVMDRFGKRLLSVDSAVSQAWGRMRARADLQGRGVDPIDGLIAATAESHGLTVVTRNRKDFANTGVPVICPWDD